jgi:alkylation response protein AidB-like acyl-CoA dehydrogenase
MGLLGFERGVSTLGQTVGFARELESVVARAKDNGSIDDPVVRDRLAALKTELAVIRSYALRALALVEGGQDSAAGGGAGSIFKLAWANWHRTLGEVAMDVAGRDGLLARASGTPYDLDDHQRLFLFSRADTLYGGSDEIQKNILAERVLGLPKEPRG